VLKKVGCGCYDVRVPRYVSCLATRPNTVRRANLKLLRVETQPLTRLGSSHRITNPQKRLFPCRNVQPRHTSALTKVSLHLLYGKVPHGVGIR
jgi:hypothetical protein